MNSEVDETVDNELPDARAESAAQALWFPWGRVPVATPAAGKTVARQSDLVCESLERLIREDALRVADALPSERVLSIAYNVSRGSVRADPK